MKRLLIHLRPALLWSAILLVSTTVYSQIGQQRQSVFGLGAIAGANLTQIDGDNFAGFDKLGFTAGLKGIIGINSVLDINIELLYSQKGSRFESVSGFANGVKDRQIKLAYAEIPVLLVYKLAPLDGVTTYSFEGGVSVARLLDTKIIQPLNADPAEFDFNSVKEEFDANEINIVLGVHINPARTWGFGMRYSGALTKFYKTQEVMSGAGQREQVEFLRNFQLSFLISYRL